MKCMRTLVLGGGAAGMAAAIAAARCGEDVVLVEKCDRVGRKLLATGNGRCNLMNMGELCYPGGEAFAEHVLARCGAAQQRVFWEQIGLRLRQEDNGRVYPASGQAATVLDALRLALTLHGVEVRVNCAATALRRQGGGFVVQTSAGSINADRVIVTGGGKAQEKLGSDGSTYGLLTAMGHRLVTPFPALTQIVTDTTRLKGLSGVRIRTEASITQGKRELTRQTGEALFTDYGVSGVCVLQTARYAQEAGCVLHLSLLAAMGIADKAELFTELASRRDALEGQNADMLFTGLCVPRLALAVLHAAEVKPSLPIGALMDEALTRLTELCADFALPVLGVKGFDNAQVTAGGIATEDFDPATLESRLTPCLHAAGEVLDVDGDCGGFNLMFAFGSGLLAGCGGKIEEVLS